MNTEQLKELVAQLAIFSNIFVKQAADAIQAWIAEREACEPVAEVVSFSENCHEISWKKGKLPPLGTKLYTTPPSQADLLARAIKAEKERDDLMAGLCIYPACGENCDSCNCALSPEQVAKYARRYAYLRERDLDAIVDGGVFAGKVPDNVVLNGADLDNEIDAALASVKGEG